MLPRSGSAMAETVSNYTCEGCNGSWEQYLDWSGHVCPGDPKPNRSQPDFPGPCPYTGRPCNTVKASECRHYCAVRVATVNA